MAFQSFEELLNQPITEVERPKPLPPGTYQWVTTGTPRVDKTPERQTPFVEFTFQCQAAMDDVDPDSLEEFGGQAALANVRRRSTFFANMEDAKPFWRLDEFLLEKIKSEPGQRRSEMIQASANRVVLGTVRHKTITPKDGGEARIIDELSGFAPVE